MPSMLTAMTGPVKAVIFDCDGVLVDSEVLSLEIELAALEQIGLAFEREVFVGRFMGMSGDSFFAVLESECLARTGCRLPPGFRQRCHSQYRALIEAGRLAAVPGAVEAVIAVAHPKAVASSSGTDGLRLKLRRTGLWEHFVPHVYSADQVAHGKPAPDLFLHAARQLGVQPQDCLVIEDSANGVTAACAAGMRVWGFLGGGHIGDGCGPRLRAAGAERLLASWPQAGEALAALALP